MWAYLGPGEGEEVPLQAVEVSVSGGGAHDLAGARCGDGDAGGVPPHLPQAQGELVLETEPTEGMGGDEMGGRQGVVGLLVICVGCQLSIQLSSQLSIQLSSQLFRLLGRGTDSLS